LILFFDVFTFFYPILGDFICLFILFLFLIILSYLTYKIAKILILLFNLGDFIAGAAGGGGPDPEDFWARLKRYLREQWEKLTSSPARPRGPQMGNQPHPLASSKTLTRGKSWKPPRVP
jgi:hypothetical protein